ncbi:hypothetical protein GZ77_17835 [Endozoicomonas montiporae]|uniref:N-acetyltransferase domain-containing protein n=2 Tax=Endozoicomonas montiporae TaxID=1027273 RepID=A0A081N1S6_9GAMM|nr:GNAT family N-acetyltransferase [Endozoicomonas montiporae]AMO58659.1 N-acetyltransferase GCN5 [Endozoicomonas montiporae CL-33]KEQ12399.1 hypothetical protein GZ77_17835 [Endozoicomonas montiporae]
MSSPIVHKTQIRKAREIDIRPLIELCKESLLSSYGELVEAEQLHPWSEGGDIEKYVRGIWPQMLVAVAGPDLVGMLALQGNHIDIVWVSQTMRQQGIGQMLMDNAEEEVAQLCESIEVECLGPDIKTIQFYEDRGYVRKREYVDNISGVEKIVMSRTFESV